MVKMINVTIPDSSHELLKKIKKRENLPNNSEALIWVIKKAAGVEE